MSDAPRIHFPTEEEAAAQRDKFNQELNTRFAELADLRRPDHPGRLALTRLATVATEQHTSSGGAAIARLLCWLDGRASPWDDQFAVGIDVARLDAQNRADWFAVFEWFSKTDTRQPVADAVADLYALARVPENRRRLAKA